MKQRSKAKQVSEAAARLRQASLTRQPCSPIRDLIDSNDASAAYQVQRTLTQGRLHEGARVIGRKIGLTSTAVQQQLGVREPDFGVLFDDMDVSELDPIPFWRLLQPQAEAEIAFVLGCDLSTGALSTEQVRDAVEYASPAIEIVDSRITEWDISYADTVADNASSGLFVLGRAKVGLDSFDPVAAEMQMSINGEVVSTGRGSASLGSPLTALTWLARTAREFDDPLRAGQVVLSGALGPLVRIHPGASVVAVITGLGEVSAQFSKGCP